MDSGFRFRIHDSVIPFPFLESGFRVSLLPMKQQQKLSLFFTVKKLAVEPVKHEDGLDKDGGEAAGEVNLMMSVAQNYHSLTQNITEMTQFKMPSETYDPFWLISRLNTDCLL